MGWSNVRKSNGKIAIWSSIVDNFVYDDLTDEEFVKVHEFRGKLEGQKLLPEITPVIWKLLDGKGKTYEDLEKIRDEVLGRNDDG